VRGEDGVAGEGFPLNQNTLSSINYHSPCACGGYYWCATVLSMNFYIGCL